INTNGDSHWGRKAYGLRANLDFSLSDMDVLGIGGRFGGREMNGGSVSDRYAFSSIDPAIETTVDRSAHDRSRNFFSLNTNYQHKFDAKGHELNLNADYGYRDGDEESIEELTNASGISEGKRTLEDGPSKELEYKIDYTLPISETGKFEAGSEGEFEKSDDNSELYDYDPVQAAYIYQDLYSQLSSEINRELSAYSIYSNSIGAFGYQLGLRGEYTYREIELTKTGEKFNVDRWDYFPTLHFSYNLPTGQQFMLSYTRRINRPGGWALEPFITWANANTMRKGNPSLLPEFINAYEAGVQTALGIFAVSAEVYYRVSSNKIDQITDSSGIKNVSLVTFDNIGSEKSLGLEMVVNYDVFKFWTMDLMGNVYDYNLEGTILNEPLDKNSFNWRVRAGNQFKFPIGLQFQINAFYNSPTVSSQGDREGFFSMDLAVKKEFLDRKLSLTLQARNLINTAKDENTVTSPGYYSWSLNRRESPMMMLNLRYAINNYKQQDRERRSGNGDNDEGGGEEF
ncbi:MAG TPA: outer membrane beta-barrel family protein, partial [Ignavibacteriales bacterium]|nr:outer membrane beta-barrel family protein [Ignavibacteriales bacterium]